MNPYTIGKCNKKWRDRFWDISLGLNSLPGSCVLSTLLSRAVFHGLSNVRSVTLKVLRAKKSVCITEPYNEGELSNCYNFDLIGQID